MNSYIATFFSHYGALTFCKSLNDAGIAAKPTPVPRKLSSSCGTCVKFSSDTLPVFYNDDMEAVFSDMEAVFLCENNNYSLIVSDIRHAD